MFERTWFRSHAGTLRSDKGDLATTTITTMTTVSVANGIYIEQHNHTHTRVPTVSQQSTRHSLRISGPEPSNTATPSWLRSRILFGYI